MRFVRCGGIFNIDFVANLLTSQSVKDYENRCTFTEIIAKIRPDTRFGPPCTVMQGAQPLMSNLFEIANFLLHFELGTANAK